jgi:hypothetical protein
MRLQYEERFVVWSRPFDELRPRLLYLFTHGCVTLCGTIYFRYSIKSKKVQTYAYFRKPRSGRQDNGPLRVRRNEVVTRHK